MSHSLPLDRLPTVLACGAWLKNRACLLTPDGPRWSAMHGDLSDPQACRDLEASLWALAATAGPGRVDAVAHDLHPDFFSSRIARELAERWQVPAVAVQHHHAHIAGVAAEHGLQTPVLGLALDGYGLGSDGAAWGGELLWVDGAEHRRIGHLMPLALPGGDVAAREPWRMAAAALHSLGRGDEIEPRFGPPVGEVLARGVRSMLERQFHCPPTSSAGRWFDAAAAALGLHLRQTDEAQAACALQRAAESERDQRPVRDTPFGQAGQIPWRAQDSASAGVSVLDLRSALGTLLDWPDTANRVGAAALWFHDTLADAMVAWVLDAVASTGLRTVCLSGGCFYNALLSRRLVTGLRGAGLAVYQPDRSGCGDAGLALGQAWVAAHRVAARAPSIVNGVSSCASPFQPA